MGLWHAEVIVNVPGNGRCTEASGDHSTGCVLASALKLTSLIAGSA